MFFRPLLALSLFAIALAGPPRQLETPISPLTGNTIATRETLDVNARAIDTCTTATLKSFIDASYSEAKILASTALSYISSRGASDTFYQAYFGSASPSRVVSIFSAIVNEPSSARTLSCTDPFGVCASSVVIYSVISTTTIYFCPLFFNQLPTSSICTTTPVEYHNIRGVTVLHELIHTLGETQDIVSGCSNNQALSDAQKIVNTDNFICFATEAYAASEC